MAWWIGIAALVAGCGRIGFDPGATDGAPAADVRLDGALGAWSAPMQIPSASTSGDEEDPTGSSTKTELIFRILVSPVPDSDLFVITRPTPDDPWGPAQPITELNTPETASSPRLSPDDLTLYFESTRPGGLGGQDVWMTTRAAIGAVWSPPINVGFANTAGVDKWFTVCDGGRYVMVRTTGSADDLFEGTLGSSPTPIAELNTSENDSGAFLLPDCLTLYFNSSRTGNNDVFVARRDAVSDPWSAPVAMPEASAPAFGEMDPWISPDGRLFVFASGMAGTSDLYMMTR